MHCFVQKECMSKNSCACQKTLFLCSVSVCIFFKDIVFFSLLVTELKPLELFINLESEQEENNAAKLIFGQCTLH